MSFNFRSKKIGSKKIIKDRGFTLIEVLATIVIISIVFGVAVAVYIGTIKSSKAKSTEIAINNLKNAASLFVSEEKIPWVTKYDGTNVVGEYICVTVNDLVNNGYFKESTLKNEIYKNEGINGNSYFNVVRGLNKSIESVELSDTDNFNSCMLENLTLNINPKVYADAIILNILSDDEYDYSWSLEGSSNGKCDDNQCVLENLNADTLYEIQVVASKNGETIKIESTRQKTLSMPKPIIEISNFDYLTIDYSNINGIYNTNGIKYYLKSDLELYAVSDTDNTMISTSDDRSNFKYGLYDCYSDEFDNNSCVVGDTKITKTGKYNYYFVDFTDSSSSKKVKLYFSDSLSTDKIYAYIKVSSSIGDANEIFNDYSYPAPSCSVVSSGTKGNGNWYKSNIGLKLNTNNSILYDLTTSSNATYSNNSTATQTSDTNGQTWYGYVKSKYGKTGSCSLKVYKDTSSPICTNVAKKNNSSGANYTSNTWYNNYVYTSATCSDSLSGCSRTKSLTTTGKTTNVTNSTSYQSWTVQAQGISYLTWTVFDNAGNSNACSQIIAKVDTGAPICTNVIKKINSSGSNYTNNTWYNNNVYSTATCSDSVSGCSSNLILTTTGKTTNVTNAIRSSWTVKAQGVSYLSWTVSDNAGNSKTCSKVTAKVDKGDPTCTVTKSNTGTTSGVTATFKCSDSVSSVENCPAKKTGLKSDKSYSIKDSAGNTGTCKVNVTAAKQYKTKSCSTCKRCSSAGCSEYKSGTSCSTCGATYKTVKGGSYDTVGRKCKKYPSCPSGYTSVSTGQTGGNTVGSMICTRKCKKCNSCTSSAFGCKTYKSSCPTCGCSTWGSESAWKSSTCSTSDKNNNKCKQTDSRTIYK